jgi:hypothetical protein
MPSAGGADLALTVGRHLPTTLDLRRRRWLALGALMLAGAAPPGPTALAQDRGASGRELREAYPLEQATPPEVESGAAPTPAATEAPRSAPSSGDGAVRPLVAAGLVAAAFLVGFVLRLQPVRRAGSGARAATPTPSDGRDPPRHGLRPPATRRRWTAQIEWRADDGGARFRVVAEDGDAARAVLDESPAGEWPPTTPAAVEAMRAAADELEARMVSAGWRALPPGDAWYAKRFAWEPGAATAWRARRFAPSGEATDRVPPFASRGGPRP